MSLTDGRCPQCGALLRAGTPWCTLCHADLRPAPVEAEPVALHPEPIALELATAPAVEAHPPPVVRTGGKHARPAATTEYAALALAGLAAPGASTARPAGYEDLFGEGIDDDIDVAFAVLRAEGRDPYLAKLDGRLSSPGARLGLIIGGAMALTLGLFVAATLVGATFG